MTLLVSHPWNKELTLEKGDVLIAVCGNAGFQRCSLKNLKYPSQVWLIF